VLARWKAKQRDQPRAEQGRRVQAARSTPIKGRQREPRTARVSQQAGCKQQRYNGWREHTGKGRAAEGMNDSDLRGALLQLGLDLVALAVRGARSELLVQRDGLWQAKRARMSDSDTGGATEVRRAGATVQGSKVS
jgi:hypothetical protein